MRSSPGDRHQRLREVFDELLDLDPPAREARLNEACAGDEALRSDVVRLLAAHQRADGFLEQPLDLWPADPVPFAGTNRFHIVRRLGAGGMGVVYEARDDDRGDIVALKTLRRTSAADLYRLKQEFRSLAGVTHPNLVCLYELFVENEQCFFTMELVNGVSFVDYVRESAGRLTGALRQLIGGVSALHGRGKLHRDIKPSNVLVTPEGRVVILDFGLIADVLPAKTGGARRVREGTPAYMAPEEDDVRGVTPSEASDWYAVGVTLYEGLTGSLPFDGPVADVLARKKAVDPLTPAQRMPDSVPAELDAICMGFLHRDPGQRLNGAAALSMLTPDSSPGLPASTTTIHDAPFVGRHRQLEALREARDTVVARGEARAIAIHGASGIGKSALVRRFLSEAAGGGQTVVLAGRCYEYESVPYKALDGVVDDLSRYLASVSYDEATALLPPDASALTRVFPVLLPVHDIQAAARAGDGQEPASVDPLRLRRRAFDALAALLRGLASRRPLVVWIDDLHWADADSAALLEELLGGESPPAMLTLLSFRSEEIADKPFLRALLDRAGRAGWASLALEPMAEDEAQSLIGGLLPGRFTLAEGDARQLAREAAGSPFVLEQLALHAGITDRRAGDSAPTVAAMFDARLDALALDARVFLEALAVCGRPMAPEIVCEACGIARDRQSLVVMLRASRFIRSSGSSARVETYHDRIREALAGRLEPDAVRQIHGRMAASLISRQSDDYEALFDHHRGAGDRETASTYASLSAEKAGHALAFDRAASFYRYALELSPSSPSGRTWKEGLATALANAGRPLDAADAFLDAAADADHARQVELRRRASEQFLTGGYIDRGLDLLRRVLEDVGLSHARSPRTALLRLLWRRARLGLRGLEFAPRRAEDIDAAVLLRLDTCWSAATGLALVDVVTASDFAAGHLQMALDAGEPARIARGLALEWAARQADWPFRKRSAALAARSTPLAASVGTPQALAMDLVADSVTASATGQWVRALRSSVQALTILRDRCVGLTWETNIAQNIELWALMYLGELGEVSRRVPAMLADARRRGNLYLAIEICTRTNFVWLADDDPDEGEREAKDALRWSQKGFYRQHYSAMLARVQTALYRGDGEAAWRLLDEQASHLRRSLLTRVQALRIESLYLRGRCALAMASADPARRRFLSVARTSARRIAAEQMPWSDPLALLLQGAIASLENRRPDAIGCLEAAAKKFDRAEMKLYAAVTRRRLGALQAGDDGRELHRQATAWMAGQQIKNPDAMTRMFAPGFPDQK